MAASVADFSLRPLLTTICSLRELDSEGNRIPPLRKLSHSGYTPNTDCESHMTDEKINSVQSSRALSGLRVLDLTGRMGGYCGHLLANLGAEVILTEPPGGDPMRAQAPFKNNTPDSEASIAFAAYHANKRGIVLDLQTDVGRREFGELARNADVLIEDKPSTSPKRSIPEYAELQTINPALVM